MKNMTQIINAAARELNWFEPKDRTLETAKNELGKEIEANSENPAAKEIKSNFEYFANIVIEKSYTF